MKKLITLIVVLFAFAFNAQDVNAQQKPEEIAKMKTAELSEILNLNGDQQQAMWRALVRKESAYSKQVTGQDLSNATVAAAKKEIDATLDERIKAILTPEQYKLYLTTIEK
jgi:hypothetical protein